MQSVQGLFESRLGVIVDDHRDVFAKHSEGRLVRGIDAKQWGVDDPADGEDVGLGEDVTLVGCRRADGGSVHHVLIDHYAHRAR